MVNEHIWVPHFQMSLKNHTTAETFLCMSSLYKVGRLAVRGSRSPSTRLQICCRDVLKSGTEQGATGRRLGDWFLSLPASIIGPCLRVSLSRAVVPQGLYNLGLLVEEGFKLPLSVLVELGLSELYLADDAVLLTTLYRRWVCVCWPSLPKNYSTSSRMEKQNKSLHFFFFASDAENQKTQIRMCLAAWPSSKCTFSLSIRNTVASLRSVWCSGAPHPPENQIVCDAAWILLNGWKILLELFSVTTDKINSTGHYKYCTCPCALVKQRMQIKDNKPSASWLGLSWSDIDIWYRSDISQKNKYPIILDFIEYLQYKSSDKNAPVLLPYNNRWL